MAVQKKDKRLRIIPLGGIGEIGKNLTVFETDHDLIIVDSTDPFGPSEGYFTREFYGICYNALHEDGIMVNQQGSPFYQHDAQEMQLDWETYKLALESLTSVNTVNIQFVRKTFKVATLEVFRQSLSVNDGKRYICKDGIHTHAFGYPLSPDE